MRRKVVLTAVVLGCVVLICIAAIWWLFTLNSSTVRAVVTDRDIREGEIVQVVDFRIVDVSQKLLGERDRMVVEYEPDVTESQLSGMQAVTNIPEGMPAAPQLFREPEVVVPPGWRLLRLPAALVEPSQQLVVGDRVDVYSTAADGGVLTPGVFQRGADQLRWFPTPVDALGIRPDIDLPILVEELARATPEEIGEAEESSFLALYGHCLTREADSSDFVSLARPEAGLGLEVVRVWQLEEGGRQVTLLVPLELFPELLVLGAEEDLLIAVVPDGEPPAEFTPGDMYLLMEAQADAFDINIEDETCRQLWEEGLFVGSQ